jgi:hypothetical protein
MTEFDLLQKPEYIHVVLNHLPIYGTILGALTTTNNEPIFYTVSRFEPFSGLCNGSSTAANS